MKIIDISMPIHNNMTVYKNNSEKRPTIEVVRDFENGSGAHESKIGLELHTGTHMDAPLHMIEGGQDSSFFNIQDMVVPCKVMDFTDVTDGITEKDLIGRDINAGDYIILKTKNSSEDFFNPSFIYLKESGAKYLAKIRIKGIGTDFLGIERSQADHETHKVLLRNGIYILEGLRLKEVPEGNYTLIAAPLNIIGVEASPVRALLISEK